MDDVRFAVLGVGHIGRRHATIIDGHPEARLVALADERPAGEVGATDWSVPYFESLQALLSSDVEVDVVCICTPNGWHARHAIQALEAGRHVVIEKPMALRRTEGERILHTALQRSRQVFCVMQNRYSPPIAWLKAVIKAGKLGAIRMVQINCFWNRDERYYADPSGGSHAWHGHPELDGGVLYTQFAHFIDILYWLLGDVEILHADHENVGHRDTVPFADSGNVLFRLTDSGGLGNLCFSTATVDKNFESTITILGERGTIKIGGQYMNDVEYCHIPGYEMPTLPPANPPNDYGPYQGSAANHHYVIQNVVDVLKGRQQVTTNALEGLKVVDIIERMYAAARISR